MKTNQLLKTFTSTLRTNENNELEIQSLPDPKINIRTSDNIPNLRDGLNSYMAKITSNEIIIKPVDKRPIVVVMTAKCYWVISQSHLNNTKYY